MPAVLYLRPSPRAFFLLTETHALVFRSPDASESKASRSVVVAEFLPLEEVDTRELVRASKHRVVDGVLGVTSVPSERSPIPEIFLLLVSVSSTLSPLLPSSPLRPARVVAVEFHSLSSSFWDPPELVAAASHPHAPDDDFEDAYSYDTYQAGPSSTQSQAEAQRVEHPCGGMKKYLESGGFFFAEGCEWDISQRLGEINWLQKSSPPPLETFDERFVWNASLLAPLLSFRSNLPPNRRTQLDEQKLLLPVIQGFCDSRPVTLGGAYTPNGRGEIAALGLISRLSWKRAGARFRTRGIDDDGQVANFVETECILATESVCASYVQVRGSVPLFWQQPSQGIQTLQQKVEFTRPPQATQPAFDKHFLELLEHYGSVHAVNLLGHKDAEERLSHAYSEHLAALKETLEHMSPEEKEEIHAKTSGTLELTPYDFHAAVRANGQDAVRYDFSSRLGEVARSMERFGWTTVDTSSGHIIEEQQGVFRVNCLDCLDRTNYVQDVISSLTLSHFLTSISSPLVSSQMLWAAHRELWADNGDRLSKIYAGTGAINTSATRTGKKTFAGLLSDATKSVGRAYINNFQDKGKQNAIDMLLGMMAGQRPVILFDPIGDSVQAALAARAGEYSSTKEVSIFVGTWNLNGKAPDESLMPWLFPGGAPDADIYMIAFQEIVELTAGQILQTDPAKRKMWEKFIMDTFEMHGEKDSQYTLFRSAQLVGTALIVIVRSELMKSIRSVESSTKKTGLQGLSGNKGGVGIRFDLYDSSICLMTCHLAAGHSNVTERNADYKTISQGLKFLRGKMIDDHEVVIWAADFNYRIALPNPEVRECAETDHLEPLLLADQLLLAMDQQQVFYGYEEGPITFRPTYKYDNGSDEYDTSEKARIPAWTDRVLWKGSLKQTMYNRAPLQTSDHRPVHAFFNATVREVDQGKKDRITQEIVGKLRKNTESGRLDNHVEKAMEGGLIDLTEKFTDVAILTPSKPPRPSAPKPVRPVAASVSPNGALKDRPVPKLPPRPSVNVDMPDAQPPESLPPPLLPSRSPALPSRPSPSIAGGGGAPIPLPARKPSLPTPTSPSAGPIGSSAGAPGAMRKGGSVMAAISAFEASQSATAKSPPGPLPRKPSRGASIPTVTTSNVAPPAPSQISRTPMVNPFYASPPTSSSPSASPVPAVNRNAPSVASASALAVGKLNVGLTPSATGASVDSVTTTASTGDYVVVSPPSSTVTSRVGNRSTGPTPTSISTSNPTSAGKAASGKAPPLPSRPRASSRQAQTISSNGTISEDSAGAAGLGEGGRADAPGSGKKAPPVKPNKPVNLRSTSTSSIS